MGTGLSIASFAPPVDHRGGGAGLMRTKRVTGLGINERGFAFSLRYAYILGLLSSPATEFEAPGDGATPSYHDPGSTSRAFAGVAIHVFVKGNVSCQSAP